QNSHPSEIHDIERPRDHFSARRAHFGGSSIRVLRRDIEHPMRGNALLAHLLIDGITATDAFRVEVEHCVDFAWAHWAVGCCPSKQRAIELFRGVLIAGSEFYPAERSRGMRNFVCHTRIITKQLTK